MRGGCKLDLHSVLARDSGAKESQSIIDTIITIIIVIFHDNASMTECVKREYYFR